MHTFFHATIFAALTIGSDATAAEFTFIYTGAHGAADTLAPLGGGADLLTGPTSFRIVARFDDSVDLVDGLPLPPFIKQGFSAFRPSSILFTIGGVDYTAGAGEDPAIAIFDPSNGIFPGFYGAGWIDEADLPPGVGDGPGVLGDWFGTTSGLTADNLVTTRFTGFRGAGFSSGPGCPRACTVVPFALTGPGGDQYLLTILGRNEDAGIGVTEQQALLLPAPGMLALLGLGVIALATRRR